MLISFRKEQRLRNHFRNRLLNIRLAKYRDATKYRQIESPFRYRRDQRLRRISADEILLALEQMSVKKGQVEEGHQVVTKISDLFLTRTATHQIAQSTQHASWRQWSGVKTFCQPVAATVWPSRSLPMLGLRASGGRRGQCQVLPNRHRRQLQ